MPIRVYTNPTDRADYIDNWYLIPQSNRPDERPEFGFLYEFVFPIGVCGDDTINHIVGVPVGVHEAQQTHPSIVIDIACASIDLGPLVQSGEFHLPVEEIKDESSVVRVEIEELPLHVSMCCICQMYRHLVEGSEVPYRIGRVAWLTP